MDAAGPIIRKARSRPDAAAAAALMVEYLTWAHGRLREEFGVEEEPANPSEVADTLGAYREPSGLLLLAEWSGRPVGVGALRHLPGGAAEIKRMYVLPEARSLHIGSGILDKLIETATDWGSQVIRLDTCRFMAEAQRLYRSRGFAERPPYEGTEIPAHLHRFWLFFERPVRVP
jgi:GNAT superfamily N-acetyltransferase